MDTTQWPQEIVVKPMEEIVVTNTCTPKPAAATTATMERKPRPQKEQVLNCPRCNSTNTKFCYYNNYSLTQPRYFCKACRRYWTEGGSLRNIPVGGGSRKNRRPTSSSMISNNNSNTNTNNKMSKIPDLVHPPQFPNLRGQDLNLGFPGTQEFRTMSEFLQVPNIKGHIESSKGQVSSPSVHQHSSALELLNGSISRGLNPFTPMVHADQAAFYSSGFPMQDEFKPTLSFALEGSLGSRDPFPFEDLKQVSSPRKGEESREAAGGGGDSSGYWTGMISGGSW